MALAHFAIARCPQYFHSLGILGCHGRLRGQCCISTRWRSCACPRPRKGSPHRHQCNPGDCDCRTLARYTHPLDHLWHRFILCQESRSAKAFPGLEQVALLAVPIILFAFVFLGVLSARGERGLSVFHRLLARLSPKLADGATHILRSFLQGMKAIHTVEGLRWDFGIHPDSQQPLSVRPCTCPSTVLI